MMARFKRLIDGSRRLDCMNRAHDNGTGCVDCGACLHAEHERDG